MNRVVNWHIKELDKESKLYLKIILYEKNIAKAINAKGMYFFNIEIRFLKVITEFQTDRVSI